MEKPEKNKIINGFCFIKGEDMIFVDLVTEKSEKLKKKYFEKFIEEYQIDESYIILSNRNDGIVNLLYKYKLTSKKDSSKSIYAKDRIIDDLIDVCYKICIENFQKKS